MKSRLCYSYFISCMLSRLRSFYFFSCMFSRQRCFYFISCMLSRLRYFYFFSCMFSRLRYFYLSVVCYPGYVNATHFKCEIQDTLLLLYQLYVIQATLLLPLSLVSRLLYCYVCQQHTLSGLRYATLNAMQLFILNGIRRLRAAGLCV